MVSLYLSLSFLVFDNSPHQSKPLHFYTAPIPFNRRAQMVSLQDRGNKQKARRLFNIKPSFGQQPREKKSMLQIQKIFNKNLREKEMYKLKMNTFLAV